MLGNPLPSLPSAHTDAPPPPTPSCLLLHAKHLCPSQHKRGVDGSSVEPLMQQHLYKHPDRVLLLFRTYTRQEGVQAGRHRVTAPSLDSLLTGAVCHTVNFDEPPPPPPPEHAGEEEDAEERAPAKPRECAGWGFIGLWLVGWEWVKWVAVCEVPAGHVGGGPVSE